MNYMNTMKKHQLFFVFRVNSNNECEYIDRSNNFTTEINKISFMSEKEASDTCRNYDSNASCGSTVIELS